MRIRIFVAFILASSPALTAAGESEQRVDVASLPAFVPAPMFRSLFDTRKWVFRVETTVEYRAPDDPGATDGDVSETKTESATCRVIRVVRWAKSIGSRIECSGALSSARVEGKVPVGRSFLEGDWVATARGLWHLEAPAVDGPEPALVPGDMLIGAEPAASKKITSNGEAEASTLVWRHGKVWCVAHGLSLGDQSSDTFCFAVSTGLLAGSREFSGGEYDEVRFCSAPAGCRMLSTPPPQMVDASDEPSPWVKKAFVILKSTVSYEEAHRFSIAAAKTLDAKLDLRDLSPDKKAGLTFSKEACEHEVGSFPCYWPRGRFDDGVYVSIEYSSGYKGFKDGLYIVILANGGTEDENVKGALGRARAIYPDTYVKTTPVYLGCVH